MQLSTDHCNLQTWNKPLGMLFLWPDVTVEVLLPGEHSPNGM